MSFKILLTFVILILLASCKSYRISREDFKNQFPFIAKEKVFDSDTSYRLSIVNHHLDSIICIDSKKNHVKLNIKENYLIKINYVNSKFWQTISHAFINPNSLVYSDSNIISKIPFYIGVFQQKEKYKIPIKKIERIQIISHYDRDIKFSAKVSPLALINLYEGYSIRAGLEFKVLKNTSLNIEIGKYISLTGRTGAGNGNGFSINPEFRYYINRKEHTVGKYLALGYIFKDQIYYWNDSIKTNTLLQYKNYDVISKINIFNIKYGVTKLYKSKLILDYFFGIGVQYRTSVTSLSPEEQSSIVRSSERGYYESKVAIGRFTQPSFHAGIKIGGLLW